MSNVEVVGMVYRSNAYAKFLRDQGVKRLVANDPWSSLDTTGMETYRDPEPQAHYLHRVYRCWNYCVRTSKAEYVCLVNSDMAFAPGWLNALTRRLDGKTLPVSRLVEPGLHPVGPHAIEVDLGRDPRDFPMEAWFLMADDLAEDRTEPGGLYMPCILHRETFLEVGQYPTGHLFFETKAEYENTHPGVPVWREPDGKYSVSGDADLFWRMGQAGFQHVTCFDSLVYHFQEGEMRTKVA